MPFKESISDASMCGSSGSPSSKTVKTYEGNVSNIPEGVLNDLPGSGVA